MKFQIKNRIKAAQKEFEDDYKVKSEPNRASLYYEQEGGEDEKKHNDIEMKPFEYNQLTKDLNSIGKQVDK